MSRPINTFDNSAFTAVWSNDKAFADLAEVLQEKFVRDLLKTPTLVFVGGQSCGKSLCISIRAGYPITFSATNIATRCFVRYVFRNDVDSKHCGVKVNGRAVADDEVMKTVKDHMEALKTAKMFSYQDLVVEVTLPDIQNATYVDLPGAPDVAADHYTHVVAMIRAAVKNPETIIVAILNGSNVDPGSHDTASLEAILGPVRPNWRSEMILIKNHVNVAMSMMHTVEEVNHYFDSSQNPGEVYHVMLNPTAGTDGLDDRPDVSSKAQWLKDVKHRLELDEFKRQIARIETKTGRTVESAISERTGINFGVSLTFDALEKKIREKTVSMLPQLLVDVNKIIAEREATLNALLATVASYSPNATKSLYYDFTIKLVAFIRAIMSFHVVSSPSNEKLLDPEDFVRSFEEEMHDAHFGMNDEFPGLPSYTQLAEAVQLLRRTTTGVAYRVTESRLVGYAAKHRFLEVFGIILLSQEMNELSIDQVLSAGLFAKDGKYGTVDFKQVLHKCLEDNVRQLNKIVPWLCNHLQFLLYHHFDDAAQSLLKTPEFRVLHGHNKFISRMNAAFRDLVDQRVAEICKLVSGTIQDFSQVVSLNIAYRHTAMIALAPMGDADNDEDDEDDAENVDSTEDDIVHAPRVASTSASSLYNSITAAFCGPKRVALSPGGVNDSLHRATCAIIKAANSQFGRFDIQDLFNTDVQQIQDMSANSVNAYDVKQTAARDFFFIKCEIMYAIERTVSAQYQYFNNQYFEDFTSTMTKTFSMMTDEQIADTVGYSTDLIEELRQEIGKQQQELNTLKSVREKIHLFNTKHARQSLYSQHQRARMQQQKVAPRDIRGREPDASAGTAPQTTAAATVPAEVDASPSTAGVKTAVLEATA